MSGACKTAYEISCSIGLNTIFRINIRSVKGGAFSGRSIRRGCFLAISLMASRLADTDHVLMKRENSPASTICEGLFMGFAGHESRFQSLLLFIFLGSGLTALFSLKRKKQIFLPSSRKRFS